MQGNLKLPQPLRSHLQRTPPLWHLPWSRRYWWISARSPHKGEHLAGHGRGSSFFPSGVPAWHALSHCRRSTALASCHQACEALPWTTTGYEQNKATELLSRAAFIVWLLLCCSSACVLFCFCLSCSQTQQAPRRNERITGACQGHFAQG